MRYIVTAAEMRSIDAATIEEIGIPGAVLMENAGRAVAEDVAEELIGELRARGDESARVAVVCGGGNNGGDGYVAARWLRELGISAVVYLATSEDAVRGDARIHLDAYLQTGGVVLSVADAAALAEHRAEIESADVLLDCLFGTGLDRSVEGHYAQVIGTINRAAGTVVSVDIPSGLGADRGEVLGVAVTADRTVTMAFLKVGLVGSPGFARCGDVRVAAIGIPRRLAQAQGVRLALLEASDVRPWLPPTRATDHKNRRGHALMVAGSPGKRGAGRLCAWAALRTGAGLVTLASGGGEIAAPDPVMTAALEPGDTETLVDLAAGKRVVAIGPGMPLGEEGRALVVTALARCDAALVLDADGLNHLGTDLARVAAARAPVVLTPHPGEAARLLGTDTASIEADRVAAVRRLAEASAAVVVLKGARTLVCDGTTADGFVTVNPTGNEGLATAGSGDVLTGMIAGLIAQGAAVADAARLAVWMHGAAADHLRDSLGVRSMTAADLAEAIPGAIVDLLG